MCSAIETQAKEPEVKIAMVCPYSFAVPGGVQEQVRGLALTMASRDHDVSVLSPGSGGDEVFEGSAVRALAIGSTLTVPANGSEASISLSLRAARRAARKIITEGCDVIHLHEPVAPVLGWPFMAQRSIPLVATFHRSGVNHLYRWAGRALGSRVRRIDVSFAVSAAASATATEVLGVNPTLAFNGIDDAGYRSAKPWPTDRPVVLFLGRDEPRKGRQVLLEAAALLSSDIDIWVTGAAPRGWKPSTGAHVEFLGVIGDAEKRSRLRAASVLCAPSLGGESFGIILLEGLAAGTPVVCSDIDGYRQALDGCGDMVAPGDPLLLAEVLTKVLEDPDDSKVTAGHLRAEAWSFDVLADRYEAAYVELGAARGSLRPE
jgi:phosphatidylinositol alpha-mannosyltransferase